MTEGVTTSVSFAVFPECPLEIQMQAQAVESYLKMPEESNFLIKTARHAQHGIIEVGSWTGRSSVLLAAIARAKGIPFVAVDTWESCDLAPGKDYFGVWCENMARTGLLRGDLPMQPHDGKTPSAGFWPFDERDENGVIVIRMPSVQAARLCSLLVDGCWIDGQDADFDFLFIDADHEYESVKADFFAWLPNLTRPATVVLHDVDCGHVGVKKFFGELHAAGMETEQSGNIGLVRVK
jgi:hypothetical protein